MTMNSKGQMRPEGQQHISPAIAQHAANECERLRGINAELLAALEAVNAGFLDRSIKWTKPRQADSEPYHPANILMTAALAKAQEGKS